MPAPNMRQEINDMPLTMVGGSSFGRYQKISNAQTWNFYPLTGCQELTLKIPAAQCIFVD